jgi:ketosteroid isomerase-like protein
MASEPDAVATVNAWLDAFNRDDLEAVRRLFATDGVVYVHGRTLRGWDEFIGWYEPWRESLESLPGFGYEYKEVLPGVGSAAAVIKLWTSTRRWTQIGVYHVRDGKVTELWGYEAND